MTKLLKLSHLALASHTGVAPALTTLQTHDYNNRIDKVMQALRYNKTNNKDRQMLQEATEISDPIRAVLRKTYGAPKDILRLGNPSLVKRSVEVTDPTSTQVHQLIADMTVTLLKLGVFAGLAAPQIGILQRVVMFRVPDDAYHKERYNLTADDRPIPLTVMINPKIKVLTDKTEPGWEGCLSLPGMLGEVERHTEIEYSYTTPFGEFIEDRASGFHARVVQHEVDHLDGILYKDRITNPTRFGFREEMLKLVDPHDYVDDDEVELAISGAE